MTVVGAIQAAQLDGMLHDRVRWHSKDTYLLLLALLLLGRGDAARGASRPLASAGSSSSNSASFASQLLQPMNVSAIAAASLQANT